MVIEFKTKTQSFRFETKDEHPKEFILTWNGEDLAINTKSAFISLIDLETARQEVSMILNINPKKKK